MIQNQYLPSYNQSYAYMGLPQINLWDMANNQISAWKYPTLTSQKIITPPFTTNNFNFSKATDNLSTGTNTEPPNKKSGNSFWDNFASNLGTNLLTGVGSIWDAYNTYTANKENTALLKEQLALQKENYYNNERRAEAEFQNTQHARASARL